MEKGKRRKKSDLPKVSNSGVKNAEWQLASRILAGIGERGGGASPV